MINRWQYCLGVTIGGSTVSLFIEYLDKQSTANSCMYVYIYSPDMDIQKYTVTIKIIVNSVKISSPIGTISNSEVVDLQ